MSQRHNKPSGDALRNGESYPTALSVAGETPPHPVSLLQPLPAAIPVAAAPVSFCAPAAGLAPGLCSSAAPGP